MADLRASLTEEYNEEYAERLREKVLEAILSCQIIEVDGERIAMVRNWELFDVLIDTIVSFAMTKPSETKPALIKKLFDRRLTLAFREAQRQATAVRH